MNDPAVQLVTLDEQVWREWVRKGKLREQSRARRRRKIAGVLAVLGPIAFGILYVSTRTWYGG